MRDEEWRALTSADVATLMPKAERQRLKAPARLQQRERRQFMLRIDYYPSRLACEIISGEVERGRPNASYTSTLDRIIEEWAAGFRN